MVLEFIGAGLETYMQRCRSCNSVLDYGTNTKFDKHLLAHICMGCGEIVR